MCQRVSNADPKQQPIPTIVNGADRITDDAADAIADLLIDRWFAQQTQPLRDAEFSCDSDTHSTETAS